MSRALFHRAIGPLSISLCLLAGAARLPGEDATLAQDLHAILVLAERFGLPRTTGGICQVGQITSAGRRSYTTEHLQLPDGSWLIDLVEPGRIAVDEAAALHPTKGFGRDNQFDLMPYASSPQPWRFAIIHAVRQTELSVPQDYRLLSESCAQYDEWPRSGYPRIARPADIRGMLRVSCAEWLALHGAAAVSPDLVPDPAWRGQVQLLIAGAAAMRDGKALATDDPHALDDAALVAMAADPAFVAGRPPDGTTAAAAVVTRGTLALRELAQRWNLDPALPAGRNPAAPWDAAEQQHLAEGLAQWWQAEQRSTWEQRLNHLFALLPVAQTLAVIGQSGQWRSSESPRPDAGAWNAFAGGIGKGLAARIALHQDEAATNNLFYRLDSWFPDHPELQDALDRIPASWELIFAQVDRFDRRGRQADSDAAMELVLGQPPTTSFRSPLTPWLAHANAHRWERLQALYARPLTDQATRTVISAIGSGGAPSGLIMPGENNTVRCPPMALGLAVLALQDRRPLPRSVWKLATDLWEWTDDSPQADELVSACLSRYTLGDLATLQVRHELPRLVDAATRVQILGEDARGMMGPSLSPLMPLSPAAEVELLRTRLLTVLGPLAAHALERAQLAVPAGIAQLASAGSEFLTASEAQSIDALHRATLAQGLPDLAGAVFGIDGWRERVELLAPVLVPFRSDDAQRIRLADGTMLENGIAPSPGDPPGRSVPFQAQETAVRAPRPHDPLLAACCAETAARLAATGRLYEWRLRPRWVMLAALATRWNGGDPTGRVLVSAAIEQAAAEDPAPLVVQPTAGLFTSQSRGLLGRPIGAVSVEREARLALTRWCLAIAARDAQEGRRLAARNAIAVLVDPRDRDATNGQLAQFDTGIATQVRLPHPHDLQGNLRRWIPLTLSAKSGFVADGGPLPASGFADGDLIAQLGIRQPTAWRQSGENRTIGDTALALLARRWGIDPRWAVVDRPAVRALVPTDAPVWPGDGRLWLSLPWTAERSAIVATELATWWQTTADQPLARRLAPLWERLPAAEWCDVEAGTGLPAAGYESLAFLLDDLADKPARRAAFIARSAPALAALPADPQLDAAIGRWEAVPGCATLVHLRRFLHGDTAAYDADLRAALSSPRPDGADQGTVADPLQNLGIVMGYPDPERLSALRTALERPTDDPIMLRLLGRTGSWYWPMFTTWDYARAHRYQGKAQEGFAQALAYLCLLDQRRLGKVALSALEQDLLFVAFSQATERGLGNGLWAVRERPRVCDYVMTHLLSSYAVPFDQRIVHPLLGLDNDGEHSVGEYQQAFATVTSEKIEALNAYLRKQLYTSIQANPAVSRLLPLLGAPP